MLLVALSALLGATFGALSNGFGLIMRQEEALIGAVQFVVLPLTFLSATFLAVEPDARVDPHVSDFNPSTGRSSPVGRRPRVTPTGG